MLTLAFAQICFAVAFQWYDVTGGDNGLIGVWPPRWASAPEVLYWLALGVCGGGMALLRHMVHAPLGIGVRARRDSPARKSVGQWKSGSVSVVSGGRSFI